MQILFSLIEHPVVDGVVRLVGVGELDIGSVPSFERRTKEVVRRTSANRLLIDLAAVTFLDAAGLSALGECQRHALCYGTDLRITAARGTVRRVLDITGVGQWLSDPG